MAERIYDAVVVGARCAGAALATCLVRSGAAVTVLEADRLGTDQVVSTHTVHLADMDLLDELGVGAAVRGRPSLILDFIGQGRRITSVQAETRERQKLLDAIALISSN